MNDEGSRNPALIGRRLLDSILPQSCVLCGQAMEGRLPLCDSCASEALRRPPSWAGERCGRCGLPLISESGVCMRCRAAERAFDSAYPLFPYSGPFGRLLVAYKVERRRSLAPFFATALEEAIAELWPDRVIVPVPPRPGKMRRQGWDQMEEIARILERRGLAVERPLERRRSAEQKRLGRSGRGENARSAYALKKGAASPSSPLIIDDVMTTCATIDACARALKQGGAETVVALALAAD